MKKHEGLYEYVSARTGELTEQWYANLDKSKEGVYGTEDPAKIKQLKEQNHAFHVRFAQIFISEKDAFFSAFHEWIMEIAEDTEHLNTPIAEVISEFFRTQEQHLQLVGNYAAARAEEVSVQQLTEWHMAITEAFSRVIHEFTNQNYIASQKRLQSQQQIIIEMSAPIILLDKKVGLLPVIGEITSHRAKIMFEKSLAQCADLQIEKLFIDLSGVPVIDTMVAQQIFQLVKGLEIIGVSTALSGISPVIAQTAVQLGIQFTDVEVYHSLVQALNRHPKTYA